MGVLMMTTSMCLMDRLCGGSLKAERGVYGVGMGLFSMFPVLKGFMNVVYCVLLLLISSWAAPPLFSFTHICFKGLLVYIGLYLSRNVISIWQSQYPFLKL